MYDFFVMILKRTFRRRDEGIINPEFSEFTNEFTSEFN